MTDENRLIDAAISGDRDAMTELVQIHQDRLFASMIQVVGSRDEAEEVVQEAFIRAFTKLETFQRNSQFFTWLYRIAFNNALTRRRSRRSKVSLDQARDSSGMEIVDSADGVDAAMLRQEQVALVRLGLQKLSIGHRAILVLREMEEHSYEEIAEILQISIGTVRSRLSRARKQLKIAIQDLQCEP